MRWCPPLLAAAAAALLSSPARLSAAFVARPRADVPRPSRDHPLRASGAEAEEPTSDRRSWIKKALGGAAAVGIVANKIAVEGPEPYAPPPGSLTGKVMVITGGNTGLGLESAKRLAAGGATVVLTSRSVSKGTRAVRAVEDYLEEKGVKGGEVYALPLDLCDLDSVRAFPNLLRNSPALAGGRTIDVLMNNAGVMAIPDRQLTKDGYEKTFQTNHLGHFALTAGLVPLLNPNGSRVINVSSGAYLIASNGLDMDNLNGEREYGPWSSYGASKLENVLFTKELQRRSDAAGRKITAVALHPGAVRTDLPRYIIGEDKYSSAQDAKGAPNPFEVLAALPGLYFTKGVERGATSQVWLASGQGGDVGGKFYQNCREWKLNAAALNVQQARELWSVSKKLSGVRFDL